MTAHVEVPALEVGIPILRQPGKAVKAEEPAVARVILVRKVKDTVPLMHAEFQIIDRFGALAGYEAPHRLSGREGRDVTIALGEPLKQRTTIDSVDPLAVIHVPPIVHDEPVDEHPPGSLGALVK
jgi:hypothetical protein